MVGRPDHDPNLPEEVIEKILREKDKVTRMEKDQAKRQKEKERARQEEFKRDKGVKPEEEEEMRGLKK